MKKQTKMNALPIESLMSAPTARLDTFLCVGKNYVLLAKAGAPTPVESFEKYRAKNVKELFVRCEDQLWQAVAPSLEKFDPQKRQLYKSIIESGVRCVATLELRDTDFDRALSVGAEALISIFENEKSAELFSKMTSHSPVFAQHGWIVAMLALMIASNQSSERDDFLKELCIAAIFHDIGKIKLPDELFEKTYDDMDRNEKTLYKGHPEISWLIMVQPQSFSERVLAAVQEHHECADGSGFPRSIEDVDTSPMGRALIVANAFAEIIMERKEFTPESASDALAKMKKNHKKYARDLFGILVGLVTHEAAKAAS